MQIQKAVLALVVVLAVLVGAAFFCAPGEGDEKSKNVVRVTRERDWRDVDLVVTDTGIGLAVLSSAASPLVFGTDYGFAWTTTSTALVYGTANDFSGASITSGTNAGPGLGLFFDASCPSGCSEVVLIEVFHVEKKPSRTVPATDGLTCDVPPCPPMADGVGDHHVNRWAAPGSQQPPWLPGSCQGAPWGPAHGFNYPPKVIDDTYRVVFELCAYCTWKSTDPLYHKYLGCQTFTYDRAANPQWSDPTPHDQPSHEFDLTMEQWRIDHGPF